MGKAKKKESKEHKKQWREVYATVEDIQNFLMDRAPAPNEPGEFISVAYALQLISANISQKLSTVALGRAFMNQGFRKKTYRNVRGYVVIRRSAEEMLSIRRLMAHEADTDTDDTDVF